MMQTLQLSDTQLQKLSDITTDIGQAVFASILIPFVFQLDNVNTLVVVLGWIVSIGSWIISIILAKGGKRN